MNYPIGEYQCKLDAKGRLMIPADFKEQLGNLADQGFVMRPGLFNTCIELYTMNDWMEKQSKLKNLSQFVKANVDLMRKYNAGAKMVKLDASGRMLIPKNLIEGGALNKEVVINALPAYMEIWDKDAYRAKLDELDQESLEKMLEDKLGVSDN
ncbi:MAG: division/cell wall cluster transcriptional repressor MraZ [Bacteroidales bacterium]|nr:division/cell wall cluster transcriptional repressor MraZ [Bacteroidales bacterium]MDP2237896.1 division/cell wall cluster transcriptional repressor MraZ [Bacteroidales bacterium]